jgi:GT2 family glycosyltransferase
MRISNSQRIYFRKIILKLGLVRIYRIPRYKIKHNGGSSNKKDFYCSFAVNFNHSSIYA